MIYPTELSPPVARAMTLAQEGLRRAGHTVVPLDLAKSSGVGERQLFDLYRCAHSLIHASVLESH